eukprot:TRINITY_DN5689_c0_g1_i1.p1 TRINITY_DN5689_c0_g1~~TRINITY_DN5689_c0_g1_i1.p1  ORF type:complete len:1689 (-),score=296.83 TRINITY_DN5689_c0_g1_i1:115-5181(-)
MVQIIRKGVLGVGKKSGVQERFFVLNEDSLDYFATEQDFLDKADPRGHLSIDEIDKIQVDSEGSDPGFTVVIKGGKTISLKSKDEKNWREALQKLMTGTAGADAEKALHSGFLDVERKGKLLKCFFALTPKSFDRYENVSEYESGKPPKGSMTIEDIERFETKDNGFTLVNQGDKRPVDFIASNETENRAWVKVFEQLVAQRLGDAFVAVAAGSGSETAAPTDGGTTPTTPRDEGRPICEGTLLIVKRGKEEPRYFVLYEDRFEYYSTKQDYQTGGQQPRGQADLEAISEFEVSTEGIMELMLGEKKLELKCESSKDLTRWTDAWKQTLDFESASEGEEEDDKAAKTVETPSNTKPPSKDTDKTSAKDELRSTEPPVVSAPPASVKQSAPPESVKQSAPTESVKPSAQSAAPQNVKPATQSGTPAGPPNTDKPQTRHKLIASGRFTMKSVVGSKTIDVSARPILLVLREDGLSYFTKDLSSVDGVPDGTITTDDIEDLEVEDNGFAIHTQNGRNYYLSDPVGHTMDEWLEHFSHIFEAGEDEDELPRGRARTEGVLNAKMPADDHDDEDDDDDDDDDNEQDSKKKPEPVSPVREIRTAKEDLKPIIKSTQINPEPQELSRIVEESPKTVAKNSKPHYTRDFRAEEDEDIDLQNIDVHKCADVLLKVIDKLNDALFAGVKIYGKPVTDARSFFVAMDKDSSGRIDGDELISGLRRLGAPVTNSALELFFTATDEDKSGGIHEKELVKILSITTEKAAIKRMEKVREQQMSRRVRRVMSIHAPLERTHKSAPGHLEQTSEHAKDSAIKQILNTVFKFMKSKRSLFGKKVTNAKSLFAAFDRNSNGFLEREEIANGLKRLGCVYSTEQFARLMNALESVNENGDIDVHAFAEVLGVKVDDEDIEDDSPFRKARGSPAKPGASPRQGGAEAARVLSPRQGGAEAALVSDFDFASIDKDGDGIISREEWDNFQKELASRVAAAGTFRPMPGEMAEPTPYETLKAAPTSPKRFSFGSFPLMTLHEGPVEFGWDKSVEKMHGVLYRNKIELYRAQEDMKTGVPVAVFAFENLEKVKAYQGVFELWASAGELRTARLRVRQGYEGWRSAWEEALSSIFSHSDGVWTNRTVPNTRSRPSMIGHGGDSKPIHKGPLKLVRRGHTEVRYFLVYRDRFEHFTDAASAQRGLNSGGRVWAVDVRSVRVIDNAFIFGLENESLDIRVPVGEDMEGWVQAFQTMFHQQDARAEGGAGIDSLATKHLGNFYKESASTKQAIFADLANEMEDERVQAWLRSMVERPIFYGLLGFQYQGKLVSRMSILFKDRLDSWGSPIKASLGAKVESSVPLVNVRGVETISGGFILNLGGRKVGIHVGDNNSLHQWSNVIISALVPPSPGTKRSVSPSLASTATTAGPSGSTTPRTPRGRSPAPKEVRPQGWVPRVAMLNTKSLAEKPDRRGPRTTVVLCHEGSSLKEGKFGTWSVNTNKDGLVAGKMIHGSATALLATSSRPGFKDYVNSEVAEKVGQRSSSTPATMRNPSSEFADKVTGHERACSPRSRTDIKFTTYKITADEACFGGASARPSRSSTPRGDRTSKSDHSQTPKVGSEDRVAARRRNSDRPLPGKIGEAGRQPLASMARSSSQPLVGKVTDAGRETTGWASLGKVASLADRVKSMATHAAEKGATRKAGDSSVRSASRTKA